MDLKEKLEHYRINSDEYEAIKKQLGREPQGVEWAIYSAMWSEHCSYKSSKLHLKKLFNSSPRVLQSFGENAGVVDLGQGERIAFKMESHNHPSFIEPYQGAATGVGGILRDIFTMGARPIALGNFLCFGEPNAPRMESLVDGVVRGIGGYGNCVGVPTVTGQTEFHPSYNENILVNAFALGLFEKGKEVFLSKAHGEGNYVVYVGAKTGRDGVHGASMASESFDEDSESKRPTVQIGDPFYEKLLIESCLEVMEKGLVVAIQDMGAAGLTSSSFEMAAKGGVGLDIDLSKVPLRDSSLTPEDILLSESQERMLLVCEPGQFKELEEVFHRWGLDASVIGTVTREEAIKLHWKGELLTQMDPQMIVESAPVYRRPFEKWENKWEKATNFTSMAPSEPIEIIRKGLSSIEGCSRQWIYQQYDQRVGGQTRRDCESSISVIRLPQTERSVAVVLGCRPHVMRFDARVGGIDSVAYPALELAIKGFEALAVTDCLNFGNPEKSEPMSDVVAAVEGMSDMCRTITAPIISGNVSFYNETQSRNITPTPSTGVVGLREDFSDLPTDELLEEGLRVFWIRFKPEQNYFSGMWSDEKGEKASGQFNLDIDELANFTRCMKNLCSEPRVKASRMVGKYGLAYSLARFSMAGFGVEGHPGLKAEHYNREDFYGVLIATHAEMTQEMAMEHIKDSCKDSPSNVEFIELGQSVRDRIAIDHWQIPCSEIKEIYCNSWRKHFESLA